MSEPVVVGHFGSWPCDKRLSDFDVVAKHLLSEGQVTRAESVEYLVKRADAAEKKVAELASQNAALAEELSNTRIGLSVQEKALALANEELRLYREAIDARAEYLSREEDDDVCGPLWKKQVDAFHRAIEYRARRKP